MNRIDWESVGYACAFVVCVFIIGAAGGVFVSLFKVWGEW
jgi:hypothetical protein